MTATANPPKNDAKQLFRQCGTCSQTFAHLINRVYQHRDLLHEKALDPLAGGIFREGHQCGMLWGATLATGAEAHRRTDDVYEARAMALTAAKELVASFEDHNHTIECKEITGIRMNKFMGLMRMMIETMVKGMDNNKCFIMAEEWAPKAIDSGEWGLMKGADLYAPRNNCASMIAKRLGATDEEATMVAGFAGGIGLSGKGCGALAVAIWMKTMEWLQEHPDKSAPMMRFPEVAQLIKGFQEMTNNKMRCEEICGRHFISAKDHSEYIGNGGCKELMEFLEEA